MRKEEVNFKKVDSEVGKMSNAGNFRFRHARGLGPAAAEVHAVLDRRNGKLNSVW
jgi:hypothetical protein